jgi:hypothetical protein
LELFCLLRIRPAGDASNGEGAETRQAIRTHRGWAISVLQEAQAIHGWAKDRADPLARDQRSTSRACTRRQDCLPTQQ